MIYLKIINFSMMQKRLCSPQYERLIKQLLIDKVRIDRVNLNKPCAFYLKKVRKTKLNHVWIRVSLACKLHKICSINLPFIHYDDLSFFKKILVKL